MSKKQVKKHKNPLPQMHLHVVEWLRYKFGFFEVPLKSTSIWKLHGQGFSSDGNTVFRCSSHVIRFIFHFMKLSKISLILETTQNNIKGFFSKKFHSYSNLTMQIF